MGLTHGGGGCRREGGGSLGPCWSSGQREAWGKTSKVRKINPKVAQGHHCLGRCRLGLWAVAEAAGLGVPGPLQGETPHGGTSPAVNVSLWEPEDPSTWPHVLLMTGHPLLDHVASSFFGHGVSFFSRFSILLSMVVQQLVVILVLSKKKMSVYSSPSSGTGSPRNLELYFKFQFLNIHYQYKEMWLILCLSCILQPCWIHLLILEFFCRCLGIFYTDLYVICE